MDLATLGYILNVLTQLSRGDIYLNKVLITKSSALKTVFANINRRYIPRFKIFACIDKVSLGANKPLPLIAKQLTVIFAIAPSVRRKPDSCQSGS